MFSADSADSRAVIQRRSVYIRKFNDQTQDKTPEEKNNIMTTLVTKPVPPKQALVPSGPMSHSVIQPHFEWLKRKAFQSCIVAVMAKTLYLGFELMLTASPLPPFSRSIVWE